MDSTVAEAGASVPRPLYIRRAFGHPIFSRSYIYSNEPSRGACPLRWGTAVTARSMGNDYRGLPHWHTQESRVRRVQHEA